MFASVNQLEQVMTTFCIKHIIKILNLFKRKTLTLRKSECVMIPCEIRQISWQMDGLVFMY